MFRRRAAALDEGLFHVMHGDKFIDRRSDRPRHGHGLHDVISGVGQRLSFCRIRRHRDQLVSVGRITTHNFGAPDVRFHGRDGLRPVQFDRGLAGVKYGKVRVVIDQRPRLHRRYSREKQRPAATNNPPMDFLPCGARPQHRLEYLPELSISIDVLPSGYGQARHKILRLQAEDFILPYCDDKINGLAAHALDDVGGVGECQARPMISM